MMKARAMKDELSKVAAMRDELDRITKSPYPRLAIGSSDNVYKLIQQLRRQRKAEKEKKADWEGQGPAGFLSEPTSPAPSSPTDTQGRMRTNDEPDSSHENRARLEKKPKLKRRRLAPAKALDTNEVEQRKGQDPVGVDRDFNSNHENITAG
jgi:hypothetical protein